MALPLFPTTVVGSYSVPGWLEQLKTEYFARHISRHDLDEIHDTVTKAAIKDQEIAGVDIVSDGELRRDNMIDYFAERMAGVEIDHTSKTFYYDFYDSVVRSKLPRASLGLTDDFRFLQSNTKQRTKFCLTGPHALAKRIRNAHYPNDEAFAMDIAQVFSLELRRLEEAGATYLQIDEPYLSGFPEELGWAVKALNVLVDGVGAKIGLHICYGNRYGKPSWEGSYRYLFPTILDAKVHQLTLEFARRGGDDLDLFRQFAPPFELGLGAIDVKDFTVESADLVASRIRQALEFVPADRLYVNPDCGLRHLPRELAFQKLRAMVAGAHIVRAELGA